MQQTVTTFYKFIPLAAARIRQLKTDSETLARELGVLGLVILAPEGINATIAGTDTNIKKFKLFLNEAFGTLNFRDTISEQTVFARYKVTVREEIVQLQRPDILPGNEKHASAKEWEKLMDEGMTVIDVRNRYETVLGTFKNAIDPKTDRFSQFPKWLAQAKIPKQTKVGIFCTGGIRCEKAAVAMAEAGYQDVYQLTGGVLGYIAERPGRNFEGECFVFDHRVAVDQTLSPSKTFSRCPYCGNGGEVSCTCIHCQAAFKACGPCLNKNSLPTCSKKCKSEQAHKKTP